MATFFRGKKIFYIACLRILRLLKYFLCLIFHVQFCIIHLFFEMASILIYFIVRERASVCLLGC